MNNKGSFVAVSDFHNTDWTIDKVEKYLEEYDHVYILGDAMDRGSGDNKYGAGSVDLLIQIMKLSKKYPGKLHYLPGNHDMFFHGACLGLQKYGTSGIYGSDNFASNVEYCVNRMLRNDGSDTYLELEKLYKNDRKLFDELASWLGVQPLQVKHVDQNGNKFALVHAFFDEKIYLENPNFCFENFDFNNKKYDGVDQNSPEFNMIWFRKHKDSYDSSRLVSPDTCVVIGHTIDQDDKRDFDLTNSDGQVIRHVGVDGGVCLNHEFLYKFNGLEKVKTFKGKHNNNAPVSDNLNNINFIDGEFLNAHYEPNIQSKDSSEKIIQFNKKDMDTHYLNFNGMTNTIRFSKSRKGIDTIIGHLFKNYDYNKAKKYMHLFLYDKDKQKQLFEPYDIYVDDLPFVFAVGHDGCAVDGINLEFVDTYLYLSACENMIKEMLDKYNGNKDRVINQLSDFFDSGDYSYITSHNGARDIASNLDHQNLVNALRKMNLLNPEELVNAVIKRKIMDKNISDISDMFDDQSGNSNSMNNGFGVAKN